MANFTSASNASLSNPKNPNFAVVIKALVHNGTSANLTNLSRELTVWYAVSMLVGVIGSLMCITLLGAVWEDWKRSRRKVTEDRNGTKLSVLHATVVEMLMCFTLFANFTQLYYGRHYEFSPTGCIFIQLPFAVCRTVGYWSSAYLSLNRLTAICFPMVYRLYFAKHGINIGVVVTIWLISFGVYSPVVIGWGSRFESLPPLYGCGVKSFAPMANMINQVLTTYVPLSLTGFLYVVLIGFAVQQRMSSVQRNQRPLRGRPFKLAVILLVTALWHCICFFPHTLITAFDRSGLLSRHPVLAVWLRSIFMLGYIGNPVVFFGMNREYRSTLRKTARRIYHRLRHGTGKVDPAFTTSVKEQSRKTRNTTDYS